MGIELAQGGKERKVGRVGWPGLKWKMILALILMLVVSFGAIIGIAYRQGAVFMEERVLNTTRHGLASDGKYIEYRLSQARGDLLAIARVPMVKGLLSARAAGGEDPGAGDAEPILREHVEELLTAMVESREVYYQVRLLGGDGKEVLKIIRDGSRIVTVPPARLQDKSRYDYFSETISLADGEFFISPINLNREYGEIELPHTPVFRVAAPVYDGAGPAAGVVVVNLFVRQLFEEIRSEPGEVVKYVADGDGNFIIHPDRSKEMAFEFGDAEGAYDIFPPLTPAFANEASVPDSSVVHDRSGKRIYGFQKIFFDEMNKDRHWLLIHSIAEEDAFAVIRSMRGAMVGVGVLLMVISVFLVLVFVSKKLIRPVLALSEAARRVEECDFDTVAPIDGARDEMGELIDHFNNMVVRLHEESVDMDQAMRVLETAADEIEAKNKRLEEALVSARKANEELGETKAQMLHSEKMASIGRLAAGVAHEINNPMAYVSSNLNTLARYSMKITHLLEALLGMDRDLAAGNTSGALEKHGEIVAYMEAENMAYAISDLEGIVKESMEGVERVKSIIRGLKDFSRKDDGEAKALCDLNEAVESSIKVAWNEIKYKAELVTDYGELPLIDCRVQQLKQVYLNIIVNAVQSFCGPTCDGKKGVVTVRTYVSDGFACVEVADNGCGIEEEVIKTIFEPFYTTKPVGEGTGLGLAIVYGIMEDHGGSVEVRSAVGEGTAFTLTLPISGEEGEAKAV